VFYKRLYRITRDVGIIIFLNFKKNLDFWLIFKLLIPYGLPFSLAIWRVKPNGPMEVQHGARPVGLRLRLVPTELKPSHRCQTATCQTRLSQNSLSVFSVISRHGGGDNRLGFGLWSPAQSAHSSDTVRLRRASHVPRTYCRLFLRRMRLVPVRFITTIRRARKYVRHF